LRYKDPYCLRVQGAVETRLQRPPGRHQRAALAAPRAGARATFAVVAVLALMAALLAVWSGERTRATAAAIATDDSPGSCNEVINGVA
jgi:hypothetical protein